MLVYSHWVVGVGVHIQLTHTQKKTQTPRGPDTLRSATQLHVAFLLLPSFTSPPPPYLSPHVCLSYLLMYVCIIHTHVHHRSNRKMVKAEYIILLVCVYARVCIRNPCVHFYY
jgi:hypothetical protein